MGLMSGLKSLFAKQKQTSSPEMAQAVVIVDQLIGLGFLKFTPEPQRGAVREQLIQTARNQYLDSEWDQNCVSADLRSYAADAEDLAEGDVGNCLRQMAHVLSEEGVILGAVQDLFSEDRRRYQVKVNDTTYLIYDLEETSADDLWLVSFGRLVEIVNTLLTQAGSDERLFALYGGNDARVLFLTEAMYQKIQENQSHFDQDWLPKPAHETV